MKDWLPLTFRVRQPLSNMVMAHILGESSKAETEDLFVELVLDMFDTSAIQPTVKEKILEPGGASSSSRIIPGKSWPANLVVDDSGIIREQLSHTLRYHGYKVLTADKGGMGLTMAMTHSEIDLFIVDINMPI